MNQLIQMFKESNARMKRLMRSMDGANKPDLEVIAAAQREFEGQVRAANLAIQAFSITSKNKRTMTGLERMNIMDETTAIDLGLGDPEADKVKCPIQEKLILRAECLDYSGKHYDDCKGCEIGRDTKQKLLSNE